MNRFTRKELKTMAYENWLNREVVRHLEPSTAHLLMRYIDALKQNQKQTRTKPVDGQVYVLDLSELFGRDIYMHEIKEGDDEN